MTRERPRRRRALLLLVVVAAGALAVGFTAHRLMVRAETGRVALIGSTSATSAAVAHVGLGGPAGTVDLTTTTASLPRAPAELDLGIYEVAVGSYDHLGAEIGGQSIAAPLHLDVAQHSLTPVLLVIRDGKLAVFVGNERVNYGLLAAAGQLTSLPAANFTDQAGRVVTTGALGGHITVVASFLTHCHETCPLYTAVLADLETTLRARGWADRVRIAEVTMDPGRDTPAALAAYARMTGADWELLTANGPGLAGFWGALHATAHQIPYTGAPPTDWYTGRPETYDVEHSSLAAVVDGEGVVRFTLLGTPRLGHSLPPTLARLLSPQAASTAGSEATWTLTDLLDDVDVLMGVPGEDVRAPESGLKVGQPPPGFSLDRLGGPSLTLRDQVGHPLILNFWATWCVPCRRELPLLDATARGHPDLRVLAIDEAEGEGDVHSFLQDVLGRSPTLTVLLDRDHGVGDRYDIAGLPVSVFVDAGGAIRSVHVGQLSDALLAEGLAAVHG